MKSLIRNLLLLFACGSVVLLVTREFNNTPPSPFSGDATSSTAEAIQGPAVVVYYLSMGKDCTACNNIEAWTYETLQTAFSEKHAAGDILWRSLDMDQPQYAHFAQDFSLYTKSVVLADVQNQRVTRWKNLERIWDHAYDKPDFKKYIQAELEAFMDAAS